MHFRRLYHVTVQELKKNQIVKFKNTLYTVSDITFKSQGRRGSHYNVDFKAVQGTSKLQERFNSGTLFHGVETVDRKLSFLYSDGGMLHFMDEEFVEFEIAADKGFDYNYLNGFFY